MSYISKHAKSEEQGSLHGGCRLLWHAESAREGQQTCSAITKPRHLLMT